MARQIRVHCKGCYLKCHPVQLTAETIATMDDITLNNVINMKEVVVDCPKYENLIMVGMKR